METSRDRALADHRELRVDIDRSRAWHEEEARLEVLQVVDRQRAQPLPVDRENPLGQKRVSNEKSPVASVSDASMSPVSSLTTNVFRRGSSRRRRSSTPPGVARRARPTRRSLAWEQPLHPDEEPPITLDREVAAQHCGDSVELARGDLLEDGLVRPDAQSGSPTARRDTLRCPLLAVTNQRDVRLPSTISNRVVPSAFRRSGA
jgi:hypothetical protein